MSQLRSAFSEYLNGLMLREIEYLRQHDWLDQNTMGPNVERIEPIILPYLGEQTPLPEAIQGVIDASTELGIANELSGNLPAAQAWYRIGQYRWRGKRIFAKEMDNPEPDVMAREDAGRSQIESAVCATRAGNHERARQLYEWAALNYGFSEREIRIIEEAVLEEPKIYTYIELWQNLSKRAYALLCLGRWAEALETAERGEAYLRKDRWKDKTYLPVVLYPIVQAVARYKLDPSPENRRKAIEMLSPQAVASRNHVGHLWALFYLHNLRALHPDLAQPQPEELPLEERARQGTELCVKWMAEGGLMLDGTPESLKLLDETLRVVFRSLDSEEKRKQAFFAWGSYFGEVVRKELAGGQWRAHGKAMTEIAVDWELGEAVLHLWPYRQVKAYVSGKTDKGLYTLWQETEQAYIDLGLAANLEE